MDIETASQQTLRDDPVSQSLISPLQLYDPLLVLLKVKLRLNDWWVIAGMGILSAAGLLSWHLFGTLAPFQVLTGSFVVPIWIGSYFFLPSTIAYLFNRLWENGVIGEYRADAARSLSYKEFVEKQARLIHSRWWTGAALLPVILYWVSQFFFVHNSSIMSAPLWLRFIMIFVFSVSGYTGTVLFVWLLIIAVTTNRLFHIFTIRVRPLHPDGSGGLGVFNRFLWISITLVMIGVCFALSSRSLDLTFFLGAIATYLITVPLLLIAWLVLPHHVMVQARNELLQPLTNEYERALCETMSGAMGDTAAINEGTERLVALRKRYEEVRNSFPTWPIEIMQLRGMMTLLILPVLLALLPLLVDLFTKK
jgi:hypothetical protein